MGPPEELYEKPRTSFVARFLGASNLLPGTVEGQSGVRLASGALVSVEQKLPAAGSRVAVGIRPEKVRLVPSRDGENRLSGTIFDRSYVGVATQYTVKTPDGRVSVFAQNTQAGSGTHEPNQAVELSFDPGSAFVVDLTEEENE
jgi:spermidine/putrescine transport system ATP-binding protein